MNVAIYSMREVKQTLAAFAIFALLLSLSQGIFVSVASAGNPAAALEQCRNGELATPNECEDLGPGAFGWRSGGNAGASNSHYVEGQSIPYRAILTDLTPGQTASITLKYLIKKGDHHAIDYLTSYDRINENVDPINGVAGVSGSPSTFAIPSPGSIGSPVVGQPTDSFNALGIDEKKMSIWQGTISDIYYEYEGDLSNGTDETHVTVTFTPSESTIVLAWGGHIASRLDWGFDGVGVPLSAGGIKGSSYHMSFVDWSLGNLGSQDQSLSADAVAAPGNITVTKYVVNDNGGLLQVSDFPLFVSGTPVTSGVLADFDAGDYVLTETGDPTYAASVWGGDCAADGSITIAEGQMYECTITNDDIAPALTLVKNVDNALGGSATADQWTLTATGPTTLEGTSGVTSGNTFSAGTYTLSESNGPATSGGDYVASDWSCTNGVTVSNGQIELGLGATTTCSITNTFVPDDSATLHVVKVLTQDNGGTETVADFSFTANGDTYSWDNGDTKTIVIPEADLGTFNVAEVIDSVVSGRYNVSYDNCTNLNLSFDGAEETCTITNDDITPELTVIKNVVDSALPGDKNAEDFEMTVTGTNVSNTAFAGSEAGVTVTLDANAQYSVSETDTFGYIKDASDANCSSVLDLGEKKTCTIKNTEPDPTVAYVKFTKVVVNDFGGTATSGDFAFAIGGDATVTDIASEEIVELPLGNYTASESSLFGYELDSITGACDSSGNFSITSNDLGSTVECTFTNSDIQPKLTLVKIVNGGKGTTSDFTLNVGNTQVVSGETNGFNAGQYTISESFDGALGNYTPSFSGACDGTNSVDLKVGDDVTCTITNNAYTVTGFKWHDEGDLVNNLAPNGEFDQNEKRLEGWQITATEVGGDIIMATTSPSGYYELSLGAGEWTISEVLQGGWIQTGLIVDGATSTDTTCTFVFDEQTQDFERTCSFGNHLLRDAALSCDVFTATPNSNLAPGTEVTLEWETSDAHVVSIDNGIGFVAKDGSATTTVASDTVFTLTAQRLNDSEQVTDEVTCQVLVDIQSGGGGGGGGSSSPRCTAFDLNGGVLSWETRHGTSLSIEADGTEIFSSDDDDVVDEGTFELVGNTDADFELTVKRGSRSDTCIIAGPEGEVLGEQVSVVPLGAADTGAGGTSPLGAQLPQLLAVSSGVLRITRNGK